MNEHPLAPMEHTPKNPDQTKQMLQWLFKTKSSRLTLRANTKGKNRFVWRQFRLAYIDETEQPYAMCVDCQTFVKYSGRTGTGGLVRHYCFRQVIASLETRDDPPPPELPKPASPSPGRHVVEELVHQNSPRIGYVPNYKGKSNVWAQFDIITLDNEAVNFAACKICRSIVTYVSRTGTGSMARHKCQLNKRVLSPDVMMLPEDLAKRVKTEQQDEELETADIPPPSLSGPNLAQLQLNAFSQMLQANLENFRGKGEPRTPPVAPATPPTSREPPEDAVRREYVRMVRRSLDVFHAMRNDTFFDLAQSLINMGAEYGKVDIRQLLSETADLETVLNDNEVD